MSTVWRAVLEGGRAEVLLDQLGEVAISPEQNVSPMTLLKLSDDLGDFISQR
jgi:hypothetical protein